MKDPSSERLVLSSSLDDRIVLFLFTPFVMLLTGGCAYFFHRVFQPDTILGQIAKFIGFEVMFTLFCLAGLCFVWAIATPRFIVSIMQQTFRKAITGISVIGVGCIVYVIWMLLSRQ